MNLNLMHDKDWFIDMYYYLHFLYTVHLTRSWFLVQNYVRTNPLNLVFMRVWMIYTCMFFAHYLKLHLFYHPWIFLFVNLQKNILCCCSKSHEICTLFLFFFFAYDNTWYIHNLPISFRVTSLALVTLKNMGKSDLYETTTKHKQCA